MRSLCIALLFITGYANAESIHCTFTEPFISVSYNSDTNIVKINSADTGNSELTGDLSFQKGGILRISMEGLSQYIDVNLNKEGSDGMSDFIYPFEAVISETIFGGCETDTIKKTHPK